MKNLVVVGDSFCMDRKAWPELLADLLNLRLISRGVGGEHWWGSRKFLKTLSEEVLNNTDVIVFTHTFGGRIPTDDSELGKIDIHNINESDEKQLAIKLYYKYIHSSSFLNWAQTSWFKEISETYKDIKTIHLHGFPWTISSIEHLTGVNVLPNLTAISLNEIDATDLSILANETRSNHLNDHNNRILAQQLHDAIVNYTPGRFNLDISQFEQKTNRWFNWN